MRVLEYFGQPKILRKTFFKLGFLILSFPATAAHCPHDQIYRVRLDQCVSIHSKLAYAYVGKPVHISLRKLIIEAPPVTPQSRPYDPAASDTILILKAGAIPVPKI